MTRKWGRCLSNDELAIVMSWACLADAAPSPGQLCEYVTIHDRFSAPAGRGVYGAHTCGAVLGEPLVCEGFKSDAGVYIGEPQYTFWRIAE